MGCAVKSCKTSKYVTGSKKCALKHTLHKIPKDPFIRNKWLIAINKDPNKLELVKY